MEVAWCQDKDEVGACVRGELSLCDHITGALTTAAEGDGEVGTAVLDGDFAGEADEFGLFGGAEGDGFAVGSSQDDFGFESDGHSEKLKLVTYCRGGRT